MTRISDMKIFPPQYNSVFLKWLTQQIWAVYNLYKIAINPNFSSRETMNKECKYSLCNNML